MGSDKQLYKTMIRSLETVSGGKRQSNYFKTSALEDEVRFGWAPEIQIIDDSDLKKLEKQEEREQRYKKRRTR